LEELLPQAQMLGVSVFVSNNASNDGTREYLSEIEGNYDCLTCVHNDETVSIDDNMQRVMSLPNTKYIFPLGDDDWIPEGALDEILACLSSSPDLLALRFKIVDQEFHDKGFIYPPELSGKTFSEPSEAFSELWELMHFGAFVVKNDLRDDWFGKYNGTCHAYSGVVWEYLAEKYLSGHIKVFCSEKVLVLIRDAGKTWSSYRLDVVYKMIPKWFDTLPEPYKQVLPEVKIEYFKNRTFLRSLLKMRKKRILTISTTKLYSGNASSFINTKVAFVALLPVAFAKVLHKITNIFGLKRSVR